MSQVSFARGTQSAYNSLQTKDADTLYFCTDTGNIYLGTVPLFESNAYIDASLSGKTVTFTTHGSAGTHGSDTLDLGVFQNSQDVRTAIEQYLSTVYKPAGSVTASQITSSLLTATNVGNVYNVSETFTTNSNFVEGSGLTYPAGTNIVVVNTGTASSPTYLFDVLAGLVDLSNLQTLVDSKVSDVKINSTSVVDSNHVANIVTETAYDPSTNKIATMADVGDPNVQSDWAQTDDTADDYIKNKPEVVDSVYHAGENVNIRDIDPYGEYELLDYVYSSANTGVDTGIVPKVDDVEFEIRYREATGSTTGYCTLFGCQGGSAASYSYGLTEYTSTTNKFRLSYRSSSSRLTSDIDRVKGHTYTVVGTLKNGNATLYVLDETTGESDVQTGTYSYLAPNYKIKLLRRDYGPTYYANPVRIYRAILRVGGKVVKDYLPAKRKSDDVVGFLDSVTGTFIPATYGTLNAGDLSVGKKNFVVSVPVDDELTDGSSKPVYGDAIYNNIYPKLWDKQEIVSLIGKKYPIVTGWYVSGDQFTANANSKYCVIPANELRRITVTSKSSYKAYIDFFASYTPPDGDTPPSFTHCVGLGNRIEMKANNTITFDVPSDASHVFIYITTTNSNDVSPASVIATGIGVTDIDDDYSNNYGRLYNESVKAIELNKEIITDYPQWFFIGGYIDIRNGQWASSSNYTSLLTPISPSIVKSVKITPVSSGNAARLAFLTEYPNFVDGEEAPLCDGTSGVSPTANEEYEATVPSDAHWMLVYVGNSSYNALPSSLKLTGVRAADFATAEQGQKADNAIPMPSGGSTGQVLKKTADGVTWANESGGGGGGGNAKTFYGTCATAAATAVKEVTCSDFTSADLVEGVTVIVKFSDTNSAAVANLKLNVNSTGEYAIKKNSSSSSGGEISNLNYASELTANTVIPFIFNGTYWIVAGLDRNTNTTYSAMTDANLKAGTETTGRLVTAKLLKDNFDIDTANRTVKMRNSTFKDTTVRRFHKVFVGDTGLIQNCLCAFDKYGDLSMLGIPTIGGYPTFSKFWVGTEIYYYTGVAKNAGDEIDDVVLYTTYDSVDLRNEIVDSQNTFVNSADIARNDNGEYFGRRPIYLRMSITYGEWNSGINAGEQDYPKDYIYPPQELVGGGNDTFYMLLGYHNGETTSTNWYSMELIDYHPIYHYDGTNDVMYDYANYLFQLAAQTSRP